MKALKWIAGIVLLLVISFVVYLTMIFNINDFKPEIINAVKKHTHRDFVIKDDLSLKLFPSVGIKLGGVALSNPKGFEPQQMLQVDQAVVEVGLFPLLSKKIDVSALKLDGLTLNLVTKKNGRSSLGRLDPSAKNTEKTEAASEKLSSDIAGLKIGGVSITNCQVNIIDEIKGERQQFRLEKLTVGSFSLDRFTQFAFKVSAQLPDMSLRSEGEGELKFASDLQSMKIKGFKVRNTVEGQSIPNQKMQVNLASQIDLSLETKKLTMQLDALTADAIKATGNINLNFGSQTPVVMAKLDFGDVDLDALLPKQKESQQPATAKGATGTSKTSAAKAVEPDLTGLKKVDGKLIVTAKSIKVANLHTQNWLMEANLKNGVLDLKNLTAQLYEGKVKASAQLDARQKVSSYRFSKKVEGVQLQPLLKDAADLGLLAGTASFDATGSGRSLIPANIKKNLAAKGNFKITNGALYGVNIPQMIRTAKAALKGEFSQASNPEQKTDFTSLTGSFHVVNGVASNPDLLMVSPLIRLRGAGSANLITDALDYKLTAKLVGSLKGQGTEKDSLTGLEIPITITGTMQNPKYGLDMSGLLKSRLKQEETKLKEKLKDKLKEKLFKKFGGF